MLILVALTSCATQKTAPSAEICVYIGDPPQPEKQDEVHLINQRTILSSHDFARHLEEKFSLSKTWGMSPEAACAKISDAISVEFGDDSGRDNSGRYVVEMPGLEHKQAVELLNELCDYYSTRDNLEKLDVNSDPQKVTVTFLKRAQ
jgi:hypothetical protein